MIPFLYECAKGRKEAWVSKGHQHTVIKFQRNVELYMYITTKPKNTECMSLHLQVCMYAHKYTSITHENMLASISKKGMKG